jgi:glutathione transport system permease protein
VRLIPGDPARQVAGPQATKEDVELVREQLGLNKPLPQQYISYVTGLVKGDLGTSLRTKRPVLTEVQGRYMNTVQLTLLSLTWSVIAGVLIGVWSGRNRSKWQDYTGMTVAVSGISMPSFWIGFMLIMVFAVKYRLLPTTGAGSFKNLILPSITLGVSIAAIIARFTRSSVIEVMKEDYVRTARAKGIGRQSVIYKHALRNALVPIVTVIGMQIPVLFGGAVIVEQLFSWPGLGLMTMSAILNRDYPVIMGVCLLSAVVVLLANLVTDIVYAVVNPAIQYD